MTRGIGLCLLLVACLAVLAEPVTGQARRREPPPRPAGVEPLGEPLSYNGEFVEVSHSHTLRNRYASKDFLKDLDFYYGRAVQAAQGRTPGTLRLRQVFIKEFHLTGGNGEATAKIPDSYITAAGEFQDIFGKTVFAYSNGALRVQWLKPVVIEKIDYDLNRDNLGDRWWFRPKFAESQILPHLADMKENDVDILMFYLHKAVRKDDGREMWPAYGGMAWGTEQILGARVVTLNDHEIARSTHELGHLWYDTIIQETENLTITRNHGMVDAGYLADDLWPANVKVGSLDLGPVMAHYRDIMRYFYTRDMWERWRIRPPHNLPRESFTGRPYRWAEVKSDYWYKMPILRRDELRQLTGLPDLTINAGEAFVIFDPNGRQDVQSPLLQSPVQSDLALNNAVNLKAESAAVLKTRTGTWLFVRPPVADVYVDMLAVRGQPASPLPVYGTVLEDQKALIVVRAPDGDLPADELGFFRPPAVTIRATGLAAASAEQFRTQLSLNFIAPPGRVVRYTLDDTAPTADSPIGRGTVVLKQSAVVRAQAFDSQGRPVGGEARRRYVHQPIEADIRGVVGSAPPYTVAPQAQVTLKAAPRLKIHYTLDGMTPTPDSPRYESPLAIRHDAILTAQAFDPAGQPVGDAWSAGFVDRGYEKTLTTDKPVTFSDYEAVNNPLAAVDGFADREIGWWSKPAPTWMTVDLQELHKVDRVNLVTYWDGSRYYQYTIELSTDGQTWTRVVDASANVTKATRQGYTHQFEPTAARYIRVNMLKNSANPGLHVVELRAYAAKER